MRIAARFLHAQKSAGQGVANDITDVLHNDIEEHAHGGIVNRTGFAGGHLV